MGLQARVLLTSVCIVSFASGWQGSSIKIWITRNNHAVRDEGLKCRGPRSY